MMIRYSITRKEGAEHTFKNEYRDNTKPPTRFAGGFVYKASVPYTRVTLTA